MTHRPTKWGWGVMPLGAAAYYRVTPRALADSSAAPLAQVLDWQLAHPTGTVEECGEMLRRDMLP